MDTPEMGKNEYNPKVIKARDDDTFFTVDSKEDVEYSHVYWYRCAGGQDFVRTLIDPAGLGHKVVGITFSDNNIGFLVDNESAERAFKKGKTLNTNDKDHEQQA
jgi:hypothetical protein